MTDLARKRPWVYGHQLEQHAYEIRNLLERLDDVVQASKIVLKCLDAEKLDVGGTHVLKKALKRLGEPEER